MVTSERSKVLRVDNTELQAETFKALKDGRALCLFPEGTSHSESHILHLKGKILKLFYKKQ